jgi:nucleoside-diphosphate-sugar epimerase
MGRPVPEQIHPTGGARAQGAVGGARKVFEQMRILLTGSEGYIGSVLGPYLLARGHDVVGLDAGFHRVGWLYNAVGDAPAWRNRDVRGITVDDLRGFDAVVHLAELSNDPVGALNPDITFEINHLGSVRLATAARDAGVERFIYMSSCSVYGAAGTTDSTETSELLPLTAYAQCKVLVERDVRPMADDGFSPTFLRNATAFGASPRMRFDLVVNDLAGHAWTEQVIRMDSDGRPWRPFVHILDISRAIDCVLRAPRDVIHGEVFNVGSNGQNYQIREIAEIISDTFPGCSLSVGDSRGDQRNYRANFDKIHERLPGFECRYDVRRGAQQLLDVFRAVDMTTELFEFRGHTRIKQMQHLLATRQIDDRFFWLDQPGRDILEAAADAVAPEAGTGRALV